MNMKRIDRILLFFLVVVCVAVCSGQAEHTDDGFKGRVRLQLLGSGEKNPREILKGGPIEVFVSVWDQEASRIKSAKDRLEQFEKKARVMGWTDKQKDEQFLAEPGLAAAKEAAATTLQPSKLAKGWEKDVRIEMSELSHTDAGIQRVPVLRGLDWSRSVSSLTRRLFGDGFTLGPSSTSLSWIIDPKHTDHLDEGAYEFTVSWRGVKAVPLRLRIRAPKNDADRARLYTAIVGFHVRESQDFDQALDYAQKAFGYGEPSELHYFLGLGYEGRGDFAKALDEYRKEMVVWDRNATPAMKQELPEVYLYAIDRVTQKVKQQQQKGP